MQALISGDLIPGGAFGFHSRFGRAVNFSNGRILVALVTEAVGPGPINIVVDGLEEGAFEVLTAGRGGIGIDGVPLVTAETPVYGSGFPQISGDLRPGLNRFRERLLARASEESTAFVLDPARRSSRSGFRMVFEARILEGARALAGPDPAEGARLLRGCGPGLTPSGDDFLAGYLFGLHLCQRITGEAQAPRIRAVHRAALGENIFSNTFLHLARLGRPFGRLKAMLEALGGGLDKMDPAVDALLDFGSSSGADLATGLYFSVSQGVHLWP